MKTLFKVVSIGQRPLVSVVGLSLLALPSCVAHDVESDNAMIDQLLLDADVLEPSRPAAAGDFTTAPRAPRALPGFDLSISISGQDVVLDWEEQGVGLRYEVWRSEWPMFSPRGVKSTKLTHDAGGTTFIDSGANDGSKSYFYKLRTCDQWGGCWLSTTVGKHTQPLYKNYTKLAQCLMSDTNTAEELVAEVGPAVLSVHMWDEAAQDWAWWWAGTEGPGMSFSAGDVVTLNLSHDHPSYHTTLGYVPAENDVQMDLLPGDNLVTSLPARFGDMLASDLYDAVPHATRIGWWDAATQTTLWYDPTVPDSPNLPLPKCSHVHVEVSAPSTWPPPLPPCPCVDFLPVFDEFVSGDTPAADRCFDEEHEEGGPWFADDKKGFVVGRRGAALPYYEYKIIVGQQHPDFYYPQQLDSQLATQHTCMTYDNREGNAELLYQFISQDEAYACEAMLRDAVEAQNDAQSEQLYCMGGTY